MTAPQLVVVILVGAVVVVAVGTFVAVVVHVIRDGRRPAPVSVPGDVPLDIAPPGGAILAVWMADYRGVPLAAMVAAREEVRRVMPDLAQQLDRAAWTYRTQAAARGRHGPLLPCLSEPHRPGAEGPGGLRACECCGAVLDVLA